MASRTCRDPEGLGSALPPEVQRAGQQRDPELCLCGHRVELGGGRGGYQGKQMGTLIGSNKPYAGEHCESQAAVPARRDLHLDCAVLVQQPA